jgi:hypothetical protein
MLDCDLQPRVLRNLVGRMINAQRGIDG